MGQFVYAQRPIRVYWEVTRACDLACRHCRADAVPDADPDELTTAEGIELLSRLTAFGEPFPHVVLTGGDPLKRADLFALIAAARGFGLRVSVAPSATPLLTPDALRRLRDAGIDAISLSLDGSTAARHDGIRRVPGTYRRTLAAAVTARECGLPFQVNTLVCTDTVDDLEAIHERVLAMGASRWSLFFLVTVGRGSVLEPVAPARAEAVLEWAAGLSGPRGRGGLVVTTTEAPQIRRLIDARRSRHAPVPHAAAPHAQGGSANGGSAHHAAGIRDGNGILFVSHTGDICPSGFLELPSGHVRRDDIVEVYRSSPLFRQLRDPRGFEGRCGRCEYAPVCGGSRARAFASSGTPFGEDPLCAYEPRLAS